MTFLFTDIEGSTQRWEADAELMRVALAAHDATLTDAVTSAGGEIFKHTGDGMCAAFTSPRAAVQAAVTAQRRLGLPVRMGIATGESERRGGDYFGPVLNRAARVTSAGHGGQILLDGATASLLGGVELKPLGTRRLRDITDSVQLFQVRATGLSDDFPPLRTADHAAGNLRVPPGRLIGREQDRAQVRESLREHRLVTLTGVGGARRALPWRWPHQSEPTIPTAYG